MKLIVLKSWSNDFDAGTQAVPVLAPSVQFVQQRMIKLAKQAHKLHNSTFLFAGHEFSVIDYVFCGQITLPKVYILESWFDEHVSTQNM